MSSDSVEQDARWWFECRGGEMGRGSQHYDFDQPKRDALARLVNPRQRVSVRRYNRQAPVMAEFQRRHPHEAAVLEAVYTPHAYPSDMTAVRLALSMSGARHMVHVTALLPASVRLRAARTAKGRDHEDLNRYFSFVVSNQDGRLVRAVRDELSGMLDRSLATYGEVRAVYAPPVTSLRKARESWVEYVNGGSAAAAE
jgi:hypothetical protein